MSSHQTSLKTLSILAVAMMTMCAITGMAFSSEEADAYSKGSQTNPLTSLNMQFESMFESDLGPYYVEVGSSVSIKGDSIDGGSEGVGIHITSVTSGYGLSRSAGSSDDVWGGNLGQVSGTISKAGTISVGIEAFTDGVSNVLQDGTYTLTIIAVADSIPVSSISVSGSTSAEVGDRLRYTASVSPSNADDKSVKWTASPSSRVTFSTTTSTSTYITFNSAGSVTITCTAQDGSGESDSIRVTVTNPTNSFTLSFNANGGSGAPSSQSYSSTSSTYSATIPATTPYRSGYTFDGWATSSTGSVQYDPGDRITLSPGTTTLYAKWSQVQYTSHLNYSASGASNVPSNQSYTGTSTSNHTFTISSTVPTMSGKVFLGWSTSNGAVTAQYQPGGTISVPYNGTTTLYAVWADAQLDITTSQGDVSLTVGKQFSYTVGTSQTGCTVNVSGASWLHVSGNTVSGTPTSAGTYDITITISKAGGYVSDQQSFTITVYSSMGFTSEPGFDGIYAYVE